MKGEKISITLKGRALVDAIDSGLIPETDDGWDDTGFLRFWELFEPDLRKEIEKEVDQAAAMLYQQRDQRANDRANNSVKNRLFRLELTVSGLVGLLFGFFLSHYILGPLIFG